MNEPQDIPTESKTPETDAKINRLTSSGVDWHYSGQAMAAHARQLELSRDEWRKLAEDLAMASTQCMCAIQGYKDTNKLHPDSVLNKALESAKEALTRFRELQQKDK